MARWKARVDFLLTVGLLAVAIQSVCLSVTRRYCVKTTARSTVQFALSDSKMSSFLETNNIPKGQPLPLKSWLRLIHSLQKALSSDTFCLVAPQR